MPTTEQEQHVNSAAEEAVLGAMLMNTTAVVQALDTVELEADDFAHTGHRLIFEAIVDLHTGRKPTDALSVGGRLEQKRQLEDAGGHEYIGHLAASVPAVGNAEHYAGIVQRCAAERRRANRDDRTPTELFEAVFKNLELANQSLGKIEGADDEASEIDYRERAAAYIEEADTTLGRLRSSLAGCWTEEGWNLRTVALRLRLFMAEGSKRTMHGAIDDALPKLRDLAVEISDRPVLAGLLSEVCDDLGGSRRGLTLNYIARKAASITAEHGGSYVWSAPLAEPAEPGDLIEDEEIGDRAALVRDLIDAAVDGRELSERQVAAGRALADELDNWNPPTA